MNCFSKLFFVSAFMVMSNYGYSISTGELNKPTPKNNDTIVCNKSNNIVIFKMITTPPISNNTNGSLKKAGKVARTSNSRS